MCYGSCYNTLMVFIYPKEASSSWLSPQECASRVVVLHPLPFNTAQGPLCFP